MGCQVFFIQNGIFPNITSLSITQSHALAQIGRLNAAVVCFRHLQLHTPSLNHLINHRAKCIIRLPSENLSSFRGVSF